VSRPPLEVADVIRVHGVDLLRARAGAISSAKRRVLRDLATCRTAALGGHVEQCDRCGHERIAYNSCRNRHCPKCQAAAQAEWLDARRAELLPVEYFHVVFTVPQEIAAVAQQNKKVLYNLLFRATAETLKTIAADPKHLGAKIGFVAVLHTWGQTLHHHPHVHCVVPGGGISLDGSRWISCPTGFFLPVRVLGRVFRGKFLDQLKRAAEANRLTFQGALAHLADLVTFKRHLAPLYAKDWVVYAKPPFGGPETVLKYLARYTHRVAIANRRLLALEDGRVTFAYKDYARGNRCRTMTVAGEEFLRRFLLHVLPRGFQRIRHFGFLANRTRAESLVLCRRLLGHHNAIEVCAEPEEDSGPRCPLCREGLLVRVRKLDRDEAFAWPISAEWDSS
jgi:hypothetical protein